METIDLLKPRYKVIADYPGNSYKVGDVMQFSEIYPYSGYSYVFNLSIVSPEYFDRFPHLFRKLHWSEERKPEDMPKYVELFNGSHVVEVTKHYAVFFEGLKDGSYWEGTYERCLPATESEYTEYINSKR